MLSCEATLTSCLSIVVTPTTTLMSVEKMAARRDTIIRLK